MRIAFIHRPDGDWIHVVRADGTEARWRPPRGPGIPHDLLHYLVETELGLRRGFWGLVAEGVDFEALNAKTKNPAQAGLPGDVTELLWSEAVAGALMLSLMAPELEADACLEQAAHNSAKWAIEPPRVDAPAFRRLQERLDELTREWRSLGEEGALVREW
jgi:hypothetical protein